MEMFIFLLVIVSTIWVYFDAKAIGIYKTNDPQGSQMSAGGWCLAVALLWIIGFPMYLAKRTNYQRFYGE